MLALFYFVCYIITELSLRAWQTEDRKVRKVRTMTYEVIQSMGEAKTDETVV